MHAREVKFAMNFLKARDIWSLFLEGWLCHNGQCIQANVGGRHLHPTDCGRYFPIEENTYNADGKEKEI
jgi:hypothetical protein